MTTLPEMVLPNNVRAEQAILGALLQDTEFAWGKVGSMLVGKDFYVNKHQWIWEAVAELIGKGNKVDSVTLCNKLDEKEQLEEIGGAAYLIKLVLASPTPYNVEEHGEIVGKSASLRRIYSSTLEIAHESLRPGADPEALQIKLLENLAQTSVTGLEVYTVDEALAVSEKKQTKIANGEEIRGIDPLLPSVRDSLAHGVWTPGMISLIGGDPGLGKSWLGFQIAAVNVLLGKRAAYIGTELPIDFLADRLTLILANIVSTLPASLRERIGMDLDIPISNKAMLNGEAGDLIHVLRGCLKDLIQDRQLLLIPEGLEINKAIAFLRAEALRGGEIDLLVVDYLQLMRDESKRWRSETEEQNYICELVRRYCVGTKTNLVAISSFRKRQTEVPEASDFRGTYSLSYAASWQASLWEDESVKMMDPLGTSLDKGLRLRTHKNSRTKGPGSDLTGEDVNVYIDPETGIFRELAKEEIDIPLNL